MEVRSGRRSQRGADSKKTAFKAALDKLSRTRKGLTDDKYHLKEEEDVYKIVDEDEYEKLVQKRTKENWIVDDEGIGYVEDGREIFDDEEEIYYSDGNDADKDKQGEEGENDKKKGRKKPPPPPPKEGERDANQSSIKSYFTNPNATKNKEDGKSGEKASEEKNKDGDVEDEIDPYDILASTSKRLKNKFAPKASSSQPSQSGSRFTLLKPLEPASNSSQKRKLDQAEPEPIVSVSNSKTDADRKKLKTGPLQAIENESHFGEDNINDSDDVIDDFDLSASFDFEGRDAWAFGLQGITHESAQTQANEKEPAFSTDKEGVNHLKMYWLDAHEDPSKFPGRVYLFGKVKTKSEPKSSADYQSCCVIVEKVDRKIYILPKASKDGHLPVSEVHKEFSEKIAPNYRIKSFKSRKVTKFYSFDQPEVPYQADYLEVIYGSNYSQIPFDVKGETISRVFGTTQTPLERLILELQFKGPCWIRIKGLLPVNVPCSWCKKEFTVDYSVRNLSVDIDDNTIPPLILCSLNMRTYLNQIVSISCFVKSDYYIDEGTPSSPLDLKESYCLVTAPSGLSLPTNFGKAAENFVKGYKNLIKGMNNEKFMLNQFLANLGRIDPDVIVGHDSSFDFNTILNRQSHYNDSINWSRLGRLRRSSVKDAKSQKDRMAVTSGRLVCDIKILAKEFIRAKSYELDELVVQVLKKERPDVPSSVPLAFENMKNLFSYLNSFLADNRFIMSIMYELNALPLAMQITKIAGNLFSRTLMGGRAERNEYLLLHAFYEKNFILPDKVVKKWADSKTDNVAGAPQGQDDPGQPSKKKAAYAGGLVLEPKVGFYDSFILLMDFNSLYPSIIQEYNICFTTVDKRRIKTYENGDEIPEIPEADKVPGILPTEIRKLVEGRREVKRLILQEKSPAIQDQLNIKQLALKLTANSMYGCLGFANSRFYAKPLAALITFKGREILMHTKHLVEGMGLEVIYGDTDSIMINTNCPDYDDVMRTGRKIQAEVNKIYRLLEIGIDGVYRPMLLLKKKKYAAISITRDKNGIKKSREMKGLDIVRRDWSLIAKRAGEKVLDEILTGNSNQEIVEAIHDQLRHLSEYINAGIFSADQLKEFEIIKQLTKNPEDYQDKKNLIHVNVALRRNSSGKVERKLKAGDVVPYIICKDESNPEFNGQPATQRAFHPEELKENSKLKIDSDYYITQQILPVVSRLCEPIEGTDAHIMAEIMGVESTNFHRSSRDELENEMPSSDDSKFDSCASLKLVCPNGTCNKLIEFRDPFRVDGITKKKLNLNLVRCSHCNVDLTLEIYENGIVNSLISVLRELLNEYFKNWLVCCHCNFKTRCCWGYYRDRKSDKALECPTCGEDMDQLITDRQLHQQLLFYETLLDRTKALDSLVSAAERNDLESKSSSSEKLYQTLWAKVRELRYTMAYTDVNLSELFSNQIFNCIKKQIKK